MMIAQNPWKSKDNKPVNPEIKIIRTKHEIRLPSNLSLQELKAAYLLASNLKI